MKAIKKINNNVALCLDNNGRELIAFGKGIGFHEMPYELTDLSLIKRTYYDVESSYLLLLNEIPEKVFDISAELVNVARNKISCDFNNNLVFTLADHINFCIERQKKHLYIQNQLVYDIQYLYEKEMDIGLLAIELINKEMKIHLPREEAGNIALHFINAEAQLKSSQKEEGNEKIIDDITKLIEKQLDIKINRNNFNYSRFVTHLQYLLKRSGEGVSVNTENQKIFVEMKNSFPNIYECTVKVGEYLTKNKNWTCTDEELLYLMLHLNRLYIREDSEQ